MRQEGLADIIRRSIYINELAAEYFRGPVPDNQTAELEARWMVLQICRFEGPSLSLSQGARNVSEYSAQPHGRDGVLPRVINVEYEVVFLFFTLVVPVPVSLDREDSLRRRMDSNHIRTGQTRRVGIIFNE